MRITHCEVDHLKSPVGFQMDRPVFSWRAEEAEGTRVTEARLRVFEDGDCLLDTGFASCVSSLGYAADLPLKPRTEYTWTVAARTDAGDEAESPVCIFETGKRDEPWTGRWITCAEGDRLPVFHRVFRPEAGREIKRARLYICGLGLYDAAWNGERIGDEVMTPYCNNYNAWRQVITHDVTEQAKQGGELTVMLGAGWYSGRFHHRSRPGDPGYYGRDLRLICEMRVDYADGESVCVPSDDRWFVTRSRLTFSGIYDGEHRDDTLPDTGPEAVTVLPDAPGKLEDRLSPPVRVQREFKPVALIHTPKDETVLDLGQNHTGIFRLRVHEPKGTRIRLQFGEVLQDGCFYRGNLRSALAEYRYVADGEEREIRPCFTFYGYRYVKVEGIPDLKKEDYTALVLHSDLAPTGSLITGHEKVNRLIANAQWVLRSNFLDVPTDCPQRDERMGWTGDANVFSETACFFRDCYAFYRKYLRDMRSEQDAADGAVPFVVPAFGEDRHSCCVWGDATCVIPWNVWRMSGDLSILREHYPAMKAWIDYIARVDGSDHGWRRQFHFGDWLALDHPDRDPNERLGGTDEGFIADASWLKSTRITAETARLLGRNEEAGHYDWLASSILKGIREDFITPGGRCAVNTQTGLLLALEEGLSPRPEVILAQWDRLFEQTRRKLTTGFVGAPILCEILSRFDRHGQAVDLLLNEEYPGWLYAVNLGATTVWERWNSLGPDGKIADNGMNSLNHYAYGSVCAWMFRHLAGFQPITPGCGRVRLEPKPDVRLGHLEMRLETAAGPWAAAWEPAKEGTWRYRVSVPFGCEAELCLPGYEPTVLTAGEYSFTA